MKHFVTFFKIPKLLISMLNFTVNFDYFLCHPVVSNSLRPHGLVAYQAPLSMGFSRQEYWSGLPFPSPGDLPNPGIEPGSPVFQADALTSEPPGKPDNKYINYI